MLVLFAKISKKVSIIYSLLIKIIYQTLIIYQSPAMILVTRYKLPVNFKNQNLDGEDVKDLKFVSNLNFYLSNYVTSPVPSKFNLNDLTHDPKMFKVENI